MGALTAERDALAAAAADLEQDRACAAHGEAVAAAEARHLRALVDFLEARAGPQGSGFSTPSPRACRHPGSACTALLSAVLW